MENEFISLYDYRGHKDVDGSGKRVFDAAQQRGVRFETREISNPAYTGKVMLYPRWFLVEYFTKK